MNGPQAMMLPDGQRLHLNHGPIDLIIWTDPASRAAAYAAATRRFQTVLTELTAELRSLRSPAPVAVRGAVAQRMARAVNPFAPVFITPMAAVAGAVADEIMAAMLAGSAQGTGGTLPTKIWINNGGDIAIYLSHGQTFTAAMPHGQLTLTHTDPSRGIATSGWRGRSQSLGIADAVTVLAKTAAAADAAATLIANAVDLPGHPAITRRPASALKADSDLGQRCVTVAVAPLGPNDRAAALDAGLRLADDYARCGLIHAAFLTLQEDHRTTAPLSESIHA